MAAEVFLFGQIALLLLAVACAYTDMASRTIPDRFTMSALVAGIATNTYLGGAGFGRLASIGWILQPRTLTPSLTDALLGLALGGGTLLALYAAGGMGMGDVKMMGAVGALGGMRFCIHAMVWTSLAGAVMAMALLVRQGRLRAGLAGTARWFSRRSDRSTGEQTEAARQTIPYGVAIAVGTIVAWSVEVW
jgi:prepilin peptidase CpaA